MTPEEFEAELDNYLENRSEQYVKSSPQQTTVEMPVNESIARYPKNYKGAMAVTPSALSKKNNKKGK